MICNNLFQLKKLQAFDGIQAHDLCRFILDKWQKVNCEIYGTRLKSLMNEIIFALSKQSKKRLFLKQLHLKVEGCSGIATHGLLDTVRCSSS